MSENPFESIDIQNIKQDPHIDADAERAVLGSIILDSATLSVVEPIVGPRDFADPRHTAVYQALREVYARDGAIDVVAVGRELRDRGKLNAIGGAEYLLDCTNAAVSVVNVESHARTIARLARTRKALAVAKGLVERAERGEAVKPSDIAKAAERLAESVTDTAVGGLVTSAEIMAKVFEQAEFRRAHKGSLIGLTTGLKSLDAATGGLQGGRIYYLAARPGVGKTALSARIAAAAATAGPVAYYTLEMASSEIGYRLLCAEAMVLAESVRTGDFDDTDLELMGAAADRLSKLPLYLDDAMGMTVEALSAKVRRAVVTHGIRAVFVDHIGKLGTEEGKRDTKDIVATVSAKLKQLSRELDIAVFALVHLGRAFEKRGKGARPMLSDLRDAGNLEQDADVVAFLVRETGEKEATLILEKMRDGQPQDIELVYTPEFVRFDEDSASYS